VAAFCLANELLQFTEFIARQAGSLNKMRDQRNNGTLCDSINKMVELPYSGSIRFHKSSIVSRLFSGKTAPTGRP
jgi:hypothetical protein